MKLEEYRKEYYWFSTKAGDVSRQLALAGIAIVWIFKIDVAGTSALPNELLLPTAAFAASLTSDLLQFVWGTFIWGSFSHFQKRVRKHKDADEIGDAPFYFNWPSLIFFWLKF